jgi:hypothetical protein
MNNFDKLLAFHEKHKEDYEKALKGNKKAGTRVRVAAQDLEGLRKAIRTELLAVRKKD